MMAKCVVNSLHKENAASIFTGSLATAAEDQIRTSQIKLWVLHGDKQHN